MSTSHITTKEKYHKNVSYNPGIYIEVKAFVYPNQKYTWNVLLTSDLNLSVEMDIFRNLGQFVPSPRSQLAVRSSRSVEMICNPFARNYETQGYGQLNSTAGRYIPLDPRLRKEILNQSVTYAVNSYETSNENRSRKRTRDSSDEYHLDAKRNLSDYNHNGRRDHDENYTGKRALDDDESCHSVKRQRTSEICVQYAIKKPSQSPITNRKILESLYDPEITAEGWEKNRVGFKYHTEIRGKCFYELGDSIDHAKELVAETALKELCNLKQEEIIWPEKLERFRLNQDFADEIERSVVLNLFVGFFMFTNQFQNGEEKIR